MYKAFRTTSVTSQHLVLDIIIHWAYHLPAVALNESHPLSLSLSFFICTQTVRSPRLLLMVTVMILQS